MPHPLQPSRHSPPPDAGKPVAGFRVVQPDGTSETLAFHAFPITAGRGPECDIFLIDPSVSRTHARFEPADDGALNISDAGSLNGLRINGELAESARVTPDDVIVIGDCTIEFLGFEEPAPSPMEMATPGGVDGILEVIRAITPSASGQEEMLAGLIPGISSTAADPALRETLTKLHSAYNDLLAVMKFVSAIGNDPDADLLCREFVTALRHVYPRLENVVIVEGGAAPQENVRVLFEYGMLGRSIEGASPSRTILDRVMEEGRAIYAVDATRDPRFHKSDSVAARGVRSMMCAPLIARGRLLGAIYVDNTSQPYCFNYFDLNLLTVFAFFLGNSLETSRAILESHNAFEKAREASRLARQDKMMMVVQYAQSEKKFRALFEQSALGAAVINLASGSIAEVNEGLVRMLGYTRRDLARRPFADLLVEEDRDRLDGWLNAIRDKGEGYFKIRLRTTHGGVMIAHMSCRLLRILDDHVIVAYFIDITDKERAERETHQQLQRVTALSELSQGLMTTLDEGEIFRLLGEKIRDVLPVEYFLVALEEPESGTVSPAYLGGGDIPPQRCAAIWEAIVSDRQVSEAVNSRRPTICDWTLRPPEFSARLSLGPPDLQLRSGILIPIASRNFMRGFLCVQSVRPKAYDTGHLEMLRGFVAQAALALFNAQAFASIREQEEDLRQLSLQIMTAQETERGRISRELHDGIGQQLTAMQYLLESIRGAARSGDGSKLDNRLNEARALSTQIIEDLRAISLDLRPTMLDDLGLKPTLEWFVRQFENRHEIPVEMVCRLGPGEDPPPEVATTAYRIVQEALGNVAKHARARKVHIAVFLKANHSHPIAPDNRA